MCYFQITLYVNSCQQCPPVELMRDLQCPLRIPHRDKLHYMLSQHERAAVQRPLLATTLKGNPEGSSMPHGCRLPQPPLSGEEGAQGCLPLVGNGGTQGFH